MKIGFIKDAFGGIPHAVATIEHDEVSVKSITEFGKSIIEDFNFDPKNISTTLPDGFMFSGFFEKTDRAQKEIKTSSIPKKLSYSGSVKINNASKSKNATEKPIKTFSESIDKINAIDFKAGSFRNIIRRSDLLNRVGSKKVLFDERLGKISLNPQFTFSHIEEEILRGQFSDGFIRKTADKGAEDRPVKRRTARRSRILTELSSESENKNNNSFLTRIRKAKKAAKYGK